MSRKISTAIPCGRIFLTQVEVLFMGPGEEAAEEMDAEARGEVGAMEALIYRENKGILPIIDTGLD